MSVFAPVGFGARGVLKAANVNFTGVDGNDTPAMTADGQILIGSTAFPNIQAGFLTAGAGITVTNGPGAAITITSMAVPLTWNLIAVNTAGLTNSGYVCNAAANLQVALPLVSAFGDEFIVERNLNGAGQWTITQAAGQQILAGNSASTVGVAGSLGSTNFGDVVILRCVVANLTWSMEDSVGNLTIL